MIETTLEVGSQITLPKAAFNQLLEVLRSMGYATIGPRIQDNAISYGPVAGLEDLPLGYTSEQDAGHYRLVYTSHDRYFDATPGAASWKQFFFPSRQELAQFEIEGTTWRINGRPPASDGLALIGVRPCELAAILIQDRVFLREEWSDPYYRAVRQGAFIIAVSCLHPCGTCFCTSQGTGPEAESGYDLALTELDDVFLVQVGSEAGRIVAANLPVQPASAFLVQTANRGLESARSRMGRSLPNPQDLPEFLLRQLENPHWNAVAKRCLSCTNCTQVCPTCFCWDAQDVPNLTGKVTTRVRQWDSCFNPDYSYIAGGNSRPNTRARYRQWLTHKLASWVHQFGVSGCVGCGRCITWCPAGIDITAEVAALRMEANQ